MTKDGSCEFWLCTRDGTDRRQPVRELLVAFINNTRRAQNQGVAGIDRKGGGYNPCALTGHTCVIGGNLLVSIKQSITLEALASSFVMLKSETLLLSPRCVRMDKKIPPVWGSAKPAVRMR